MSKILIIFGLIMMSIGFARVANAQEDKKQKIKLAQVCEGSYWAKNYDSSISSDAQVIRVYCIRATHCAGLNLITNSTGSKNKHEKPLEEVTCVLPYELMFVNSNESNQLETEAENYL